MLSSSWRTDPVGLVAARFYGVPYTDVCPDIPGVSRCEEMLQWLSAHQDVHRYVVIDDAGQLVEPIVRYLKYLDRIGAARNTIRSYATVLKQY